MRHVIVLGAVAAALALAPAAASGGWATVGFAPLPDDTSAGSTWSPTIYVKQHGVTPMTGLTPMVNVYRDDSGAMESFAATELEPGVYRADVVFPKDGDWRVAIESGFAGSNVTYGPFEIGAPNVTGGGSSELPVVGLGLAILAFLGGVAVVAARRSRRLTPASG